MHMHARAPTHAHALVHAAAITMSVPMPMRHAPCVRVRVCRRGNYEGSGCMLTEAATTASILLRALCQLLPDLLGHGPVAARAAELYRPSSYQNRLRVATSPSPVPGASPGGAPRAREAALEASARLRSHLAYSNQAKEFRKHQSKSAEQQRALDVWEVKQLQLGGAADPARGHAGFWHVPRVKFVLRSSLEVLYLGLLAWVLLRERACVGAAGELLLAPHLDELALYAWSFAIVVDEYYEYRLNGSLQALTRRAPGTWP